MPRASDGNWSDIPNITAVPGQTIKSADWNNYRADLRNNEFNAARPITAGGTGATNAADALTNLGGVGVSNFLDAFAVGDFFETLRTLDESWLKRDGSLYDVDTYPELAALLPDLPDGVDWSSLASLTGTVQSIIQTPNGFMAASDTAGATNIYTSPTGSSWALVSTIPTFSVEGLIYQGGIYVAVDGNGKGAVSNDGITWGAAFNIFTPGSGVGLTKAAFSNGTYVAVGTGGRVSTSTDGTTWTARTSGVGTTLWSVRYVNNRFVAVGSGGVVLSSTTDGASWVPHTTGITDTLNDIAYGNGLYVVVGAGGRIITSATLSGWIVRTSGTSSSLDEVVYSTSGFLAVGNAGAARISSDAATWSSAPTGVSAALFTVVVDPDAPNRYLAGGSSGTLLQGIRTLPTQFRVPSDDPTYGWIRAVPIAD